MSLLHSNMIKSRSIAEEDALPVVQKLAGPGDKRVGFQRWYPRMWDEWARNADHVIRTDLTSNEAELELSVRDDVVIIPCLAPDFVDDTLGVDEKWVNVINFNRSSGSRGLPHVIPPLLQNAERLLGYITANKISAGSEGIVVRCTALRTPTYLKIPDGFSLFSAWFAQHGLRIKVSDAGRVAEQILASLGGIQGGWAIASREVLTLLNEMAHGLAETTPIQESSQSQGKAIPRGRAVPRERWLALLGRLHRHEGRARQHLDFLLSHEVLKPGFRMECSKCGQGNWYPLSEMAEELRCERCLRFYKFPAIEPPKYMWYYRTNGPFSTERYARGSYSVVLALRALSGHFGERPTTWATGIQVENSNGKDLEADFALWQRERWLGRTRTWLVFGEAKSFADDAFEPRDINRAKAFAEKFPGAILVFATMRTELTTEEKQRFSRLAIWGRYAIGNDRTRAPV